MIRIPVTLQLISAGQIVTIQGVTQSVSPHGAMVVCSRSITSKTTIQLENDRTHEKQACRVARTPVENGRSYVIPLDFTSPAAAFWGISFPADDVKTRQH
jgi:hypothetical protein